MLQVFFCGFFCLVSVFAKGGNLFLYPSEVMRFFQADDSVDQALALAAASGQVFGRRAIIESVERDTFEINSIMIGTNEL